MNTQGKSALAVAVAAAIGAAPDAADAALYTATLTQVLTYSNNGTAGTAANISSSTATWSYDSVTNLLSQTGGTFNLRLTTAPTSTLYRTTITGLVFGNGGVASATTYACLEGNFGGGVGASICGNYNFGADFNNDSTTSWGPGTAVSRTIGGDDVSIGAQQDISALNNFTTATFTAPPSPPTPGGSLVLTNKTCTAQCTTTAGGFNNGQQWTLGSLVEVFQGTVDDTGSAESGQQNSLDVLGNDVGFADPVTVTTTGPGTVAPNQGGTVAVVGSPGPAASVRINYTSAPNFSGTETFTYRAVSGALTDSGLVTVTVEDTVPTAITFTSQTGVALSTPVTSASTAIAGISTAVPIAVSAGSEYSIDGGGFTAAPGTVQNNQDVVVRHTSAALPATNTVTTLTVGGFSTVQGTFTSTTELPDTNPNPFSFDPQVDVALGTAIDSAPATITGINAATPISVTGGQYSIAGGAFTAVAGTVNNNQSVRVRVTSSATPLTDSTATLTVGGVDADFTVTTAEVQPDTTPDQFHFVDQDNVDQDTVIISEPVEITGINAPAPILVTGGEYSIDGGAFTTEPGTVSEGQQVVVRHTSASTSGTAVTTILSVGPAGAGTRISDAFSSGTRRGGGSSSADGLILGVLGLLGLARRRKNRG